MADPIMVQPTATPADAAMKLNTSGLAALAPMTGITVKEERTFAECCIGDKIPCVGTWGFAAGWPFGCGPPKKRFYVTHPNSPDQQIYFMKEDSPCMQRRCAHRMRGFTITAYDASSDKELFRIIRDFKCGACCCNTCWPCGLYGWMPSLCTDGFQVRIESADGQLIGFAEQQESCCALEFVIYNALRNPLYRFQTSLCNGCCSNPCCLFPATIPAICRWLTCCSDITAKLETPNGQDAGTIKWQYPGCVDDFFCCKHKFGVEFPADSGPEMKAVIIGTTVLFETYFRSMLGAFCW